MSACSGTSSVTKAAGCFCLFSHHPSCVTSYFKTISWHNMAARLRAIPFIDLSQKKRGSRGVSTVPSKDSSQNSCFAPYWFGASNCQRGCQIFQPHTLPHQNLVVSREKEWILVSDQQALLHPTEQASLASAFRPPAWISKETQF